MCWPTQRQRDADLHHVAVARALPDRLRCAVLRPPLRGRIRAFRCGGRAARPAPVLPKNSCCWPPRLSSKASQIAIADAFSVSSGAQHRRRRRPACRRAPAARGTASVRAWRRAAAGRRRRARRRGSDCASRCPIRRARPSMSGAPESTTGVMSRALLLLTAAQRIARGTAVPAGP